MAKPNQQVDVEQRERLFHVKMQIKKEIVTQL